MKVSNMIPTDLIEKRYICSVLEEMRKADESKNYSYLKGLIEEAQSYANRMEAGLSASRSSSYKAWEQLKAALEAPMVADGRKMVKEAIEIMEKRWAFSKDRY